MKKIILSVFALTLVVLPAFCGEQKESTIHTSATINREVMPDTVKIRFYVENSGLNLSDIKAKNDKTVNVAIGAIKTLLNENESIKTIAFSVRDVYSYKDKVRVFQKYEVTNGFEVKLKETDKISKVIDTALASGVKRVDKINFLVENSENVCNEMMSEVVKMAKNRVEYIAKSSNYELDKVKHINPYCSLSSGHVQPRTYASYSANKSMGAVSEDSVIESIELGAINANASVDLTYYLK